MQKIKLIFLIKSQKVRTDISNLKGIDIIFKQWNYNKFLAVEIMVRDANKVN
jgi:hypothetical protein